jgi:adenylosuccinate lyase
LKTAEIIYTIARINTIIKNIAVDFWLYIMDEWIVQKNIGTTGSSTMPHKINPINFENAEGNVCVANALLYELISTDISVNNNEFDWKEAIGYSLLAAKSILKGLEKTSVNITKITAALQQHPEVIAEAYQTELRKPEYKIADPYNLIKQFTQGKQVTLQLLHEFIDSLTIPSAAKNKLKALTSEQYIGVAAVLASKQVKN